MKVGVYKISQSAPDDLAELAHFIKQQTIDPQTIVAIMGKTEGNGCVNDFTRGFAVATIKRYLSDLVGKNLADRIVFVMSGGTEGVLSPHLTIFTQQAASPEETARAGLALGVFHTRDFSSEEIGTLAMVEVVAAGVREAIATANIEAQDVHFVQIKCPLLTAARTEKSKTAIAQDSYKSMAYSRGASALGVALALGEIEAEQLTAADICSNYSLYSAVASTSAGIEVQNCEILVLGNSPNSHSDYFMGHSVMAHALDTSAIQQAIESARSSADLGSIVTIFAKAEAAPSGTILGYRHTMLDDSDISHTRMARAVVGAVIASMIQDPMIYVSGGSEHQGPAGGGPVVVISKLC